MRGKSYTNKNDNNHEPCTDKWQAMNNNKWQYVNVYIYIYNMNTYV